MGKDAEISTNQLRINGFNDETTPTHLSSTIQGVDPNLVRLREPPHPDVLARVSEFIQPVDCFIQSNCFRNLLETKGGLDSQGDGNEEACATKAAEGCLEEVSFFRLGAPDHSSVRQE